MQLQAILWCWYGLLQRYLEEIWPTNSKQRWRCIYKWYGLDTDSEATLVNDKIATTTPQPPGNVTQVHGEETLMDLGSETETSAAGKQQDHHASGSQANSPSAQSEAASAETKHDADQ